jgi:glycosyltransferase 2 family protein
MPAMKPTSRSHNRFITVLILAITVVGVVLVALDWQEMRKVLVEADWHFLPLVILFTFFSYTFYSYAYAIVSQMLGIPMGKRELAEVCFISTVINHVLTTGGVVGYSLRYMLMKMYNVTLKDVLTSSILHYYLTSLDMLTFLPLSFLYLLLNAAVPRGVVIALGLMTLLFGLVLILITGLVLFPSRRRPIIRLLARIGRRILRRDLISWLTQFDETLTCGTEAIRHKPLQLVWIMLLTLLDFASSIIAMGFVFEALGPPVKAGALVTGYVIGIMAGLLSMIPGGLVVQEGSMAGIFALLGVKLEQAVLATILFRILYYLLPYFLILPFYNRLLHRASKQAPSEP